MYNIIAFCALVLGLSRGVISRKCVDCMNYDRCPVALDLSLNNRTRETVALFRRALCGMDQSGTSQIPMVCCSMFSTTFGSGDVTDSPEDIRVANHKNLQLLPAECGEIKGNRMIEGEIADLSEFPWMALISHETRDGLAFKCAGTIINRRYILTAAHCVHNKNIAGVRVGEYNVNTDIDCHYGVCEIHIQDLPVEKSVIHEGYRGLPTVVNDIALLRLADDMDFTYRNVRPICLPKTSELRNETLSNMLATVIGWGINENAFSVLHKFDITVYTDKDCSDLYNRFARPGQLHTIVNQFCAGSPNKDSCKGDSGGPLMLERRYNNIDRYIQYGVVSYGPVRCGSEYPGVYTDVTKFMGWILDNIY